MLRPTLSFFLAAGLSTFIIFVVFQDVSWHGLPQAIGLGEVYGPSKEQIASGDNILPDLRTLHNDISEQHRNEGLVFVQPSVNSTSPYPIGTPKPPGSKYTRTLVIASTKAENTSWIEPELGDLLEEGWLKTAIYVADDIKAPLHPPKNKGHEAMIYLSYIIDHYDKLPEINIFMHAHRAAWHNDELMDFDAAEMVRYLSSERVTRLGYMNLRCEWEPGCPDWLHPGTTVRDPDKKEEVLIAAQWAELFPLDPIPTVLASACCAQFAVSRERILSIPRQRYMFMRDWLIRTSLDDSLSGRIFEYIWQYIFTASPIDCPAMSACYCDGYGLCFGSAETFDYWFELRWNLHELKHELGLWKEKVDLIEEFRANSRDGRLPDVAPVMIPEVGKGEKLQQSIDDTLDKMRRMRHAAWKQGQSPQHRAWESGREWKEGDGF